ncbi:MAG: SDR family oxidoreductase [Methylobacteriaceae bacterium]|nr:SDR family oxidoreductase [Methylobacteriaceae bacterium]MCO5085412.1 SDR family oxidoreductase [Methylobacteriaceae bacterium]
MADLTGKFAVITGAASGIGRATAQLFAERGAKVLAVDRPESAIATAHEGNGAIKVLAKSVADDDAPETIVKAALDAYGAIDILFNNAGVSGRSLTHETSDAEWDRQFAVNVRAPFRISRAAIPHLIKRAEEKGRARIICTASVMAFDTDIGLCAYTSSKHAVAGLTKTMALELGKYKVTANYILPGAIHTGMTQASFADPFIRGVWEKKAALRRLGEPIDMARAALLLASDEADFITGHGLVADGGLTLRT